MKKLIALVCCMVFVAQFSAVSARNKYPTMVVWQDGKAVAKGNTAQIDSVTFTTSYYIVDGHEFVDLGLPSGMLWATTNVGAETAADYGEYYSWGEISIGEYYWDTYKFGSSVSELAKYFSGDGKTTLEAGDDVAYTKWGTSCRIPTIGEFTELINNCTLTWTTMANSDSTLVNGYKVTSKTNGNSIFLPAAGYKSGPDNLFIGENGYYWSSTLDTTDYALAKCWVFQGSDFQYRQGCYRVCGRPVRPVAEP